MYALGGIQGQPPENTRGGYKEVEGSLFARSHVEKTRGNKFKLHWERFLLNTRKKFFHQEESITVTSFLRDVVEPPLLEIFKMKLDRMLDSLI